MPRQIYTRTFAKSLAVLAGVVAFWPDSGSWARRAEPMSEMDALRGCAGGVSLGFDAQLSACNALVANDKANPMSRIHRATFLQESGSSEAHMALVLEDLDLLIEAHPDGEVYSQRAYVRAWFQDWDGALTDINAAIETRRLGIHKAIW